MKLLYSRLGDAHQVTVMPMRIICMPFEMRPDGLYLRIVIPRHINPLIHFHVNSPRHEWNNASKLNGFDSYYE
jgi:hypothetical protein